MKKIALFLGLVASVVLFSGCATQKPVADNAATTQPAPVKAKDLKGESI
jgi:ABC-type Fe3+-hydroxamate transport system substrate-binding protein